MAQTFANSTLPGLALNWYHARQARMVVGAEQRQHKQAMKLRTGIGSASHVISIRLSAAKRVELAAAKALAQACAKSLEIPTFNVDAVEVTLQKVGAMPSTKNQLESK